MIIVCPHCERTVEKATGLVNRARKAGLTIYCSKICSGLARRVWKPDEQKKTEKWLYDLLRRNRLRDRLKAEKAAHHKLTYDPEKARIVRAKNMPRHVEYCRRPEYRAKKVEYDKVRQAKRNFGEFYEAALLVGDLNTEVRSRISKYESSLINGTLNKATQRKRDYERLNGHGT